MIKDVFHTNSYREKLLNDIGVKTPESDLNEKDWMHFSRNKYLGEEFIREFQDFVSWGNICIIHNFTDDFLYEFKHKVDWNVYFRYQKTSAAVMKKFILKSNIEDVSKTVNALLTVAQKQEIQKMLDIKYLFTN
jgi:hypothetical protein